MTGVLTDGTVEGVLGRLPGLAVAVVGDLFLDRYLDLDAALTEPSLETGLDAYQVTGVRSCPGAAGTIINNLAALGVGRVVPVAVVGDDGEGYELRQALRALKVMEDGHLIVAGDRRTPTYTKPLLHEAGRPPRELNRLDIKNRVPTGSDAERKVLAALGAVWPVADAVVVLDQVSEEDCGVITKGVRDRLSRLARDCPGKFVLADSRERIGLFADVCLKPNERECRRALGVAEGAVPDPMALARRAGRAVFLTRGEAGIVVADPPHRAEVPAFPVGGPVDVVGAGDATSAGIACAMAAGASAVEAAAFGCLIASITVRQIGTTGTASPGQVRARWQEVREG